MSSGGNCIHWNSKKIKCAQRKKEYVDIFWKSSGKIRIDGVNVKFKHITIRRKEKYGSFSY